MKTQDTASREDYQLTTPMVAAYPMVIKPMMPLMYQAIFKRIRSFGQSSPYPWEQGSNTIKSTPSPPTINYPLSPA